MAFTITIDQEEIETAIQNHVRSKVSIAEGQALSIDMKAGRGDAGFTATINIGDAAPAAAPTTEAAKAVTGTTRVNGKTVTETAKEAPQADVEAAPEGEAEVAAVAEEVAEPAKAGSKLFGAATTGRNIP